MAKIADFGLSVTMAAQRVSCIQLKLAHAAAHGHDHGGHIQLFSDGCVWGSECRSREDGLDEADRLKGVGGRAYKALESGGAGGGALQGGGLSHWICQCWQQRMGVVPAELPLQGALVDGSGALT